MITVRTPGCVFSSATQENRFTGGDFEFKAKCSLWKISYQLFATVASHGWIYFSPMSRQGRILNEALLFCMGQGICDHGPPFYSSLYGNPDHGEKYVRLNKEKPQKGVLESGICYTWEVRLTGEGEGNLSSRLVRTARRFYYMQILY